MALKYFYKQHIHIKCTAQILEASVVEEVFGSLSKILIVFGPCGCYTIICNCHFTLVEVELSLTILSVKMHHIL